ncbi:MAG: heme-dependent peroxidase [Gemmatimonadetes bacterium]|nr:heme-dependent peroxidase [Gemmatimonadota bacterium]
MSQIAPATLEGWYALHQVFSTDWPALRGRPHGDRLNVGEAASALFQQIAEGPGGGWSAAFRLVGGGGDWMFVHFRPTLDELADVELRLRDTALGELLRLEYDYLSVTEAGLYHATAEAAQEAAPGSAEFRALVERARQAEAASAHVHTRLYPQVPEGMRYVSFYPMSKRRGEQNNWYALPVDERSRLMREHGMTGRTFAGRIFQVITGSVGLDDWEWGVTLFARDPLEFKRIVTEMRYDQASALYGEFGRFFTGIRFAPGEWPALLGAQGPGA